MIIMSLRPPPIPVHPSHVHGNEIFVFKITHTHGVSEFPFKLHARVPPRSLDDGGLRETRPSSSPRRAPTDTKRAFFPFFLIIQLPFNNTFQYDAIFFHYNYRYSRCRLFFSFFYYSLYVKLFSIFPCFLFDFIDFWKDPRVRDTGIMGYWQSMMIYYLYRHTSNPYNVNHTRYRLKRRLLLVFPVIYITFLSTG